MVLEGEDIARRRLRAVEHQAHSALQRVLPIGRRADEGHGRAAKGAVVAPLSQSGAEATQRMQNRLLGEKVEERAVEADITGDAQQLQGAVVVQQDAVAQGADEDALVQIHEDGGELIFLLLDARRRLVDGFVDRVSREAELMDQLVHSAG
jgi:hypothetical protein